MVVIRSRVKYLTVAVIACAASIAPRTSAGAQEIDELTATPDAAADVFIRSIRAIRWSAAAQLMAPEALDRFRVTVTMMANADTTGEIREYLVGTDSLGLSALSADEVFARAIGTLIDDMPGLMHSIYDRDDEVIGHVAEGADEAHAVYRTTARLSGAISEVKVMQLRRGPAGWRVFWSDELEVLDAALRGVGR